MSRGVALIRQMGPFWPDMIEPGVWGIEAQNWLGGHFVCRMELLGTPEGSFNTAQAMCDTLNSVAGFSKADRRRPPKGSTP